MSPLDRIWTAVVVLCTLSTGGAAAAVDGVTVEAPFSWRGLRGTVRLSQASPAHNVTITVDVTLMEDEAAGSYRLRVSEFPADYTREDYCDDSVTGKPIKLEGPRAPDLEYDVAEARFQSPVAGAVFIRQYRVNGTRYTSLHADLAHSGSSVPTSSQHGWSVMVTDVLTTAADESRGTCNFLQLVYDPHSADPAQCTEDTPELCKAGDLLSRLGKIKVASRRSRFTRQFWTSDRLELPPWRGYRSAYLVLYEKDYPDSILACAKIRPVQRRTASAFLSYDGVHGVVELSQRSRADTFGVHSLPVPPRAVRRTAPCERVGAVFNPTEVDAELTEPAGGATGDRYPLGDLSGKHGRLTGLDSFEAEVSDFSLPLWGPRSVVGRSLVITAAGGGEGGAGGAPWVCANLQDSRPMVTAAAVFRFPLAGRVLFLQPEDAPEEDTTVLLEGLLYNDGSMNGTGAHRWNVNELVPGADFRNWSGRCLSAGPRFNPYQVNSESRLYSRSCSAEEMTNCEMGDMVSKHGTLNLAALRDKLNETRRLWTDTNLPLSGPNSIIGHSLVIHDDNGPKARGDRLACVE
ncbi:Superoxide dismutase [Cu-Zn] [Amphibalanus amphitrite]|uniref:Superoxide dismutase [Cu-Zn] n=1 Tax=Amphibalanus amphitrite TaxID=1232801 RepID=A0A6A4X5Z0_AMPAM|nr:Superoxide dismutase [Cu-Zn] [Amphibalanus amphitrite]